MAAKTNKQTTTTTNLEEHKRIQSLQSLLFITPRIQFKTTRHIKETRRLYLYKKQSRKTNPEMTQMLELADKDFKAAIISMLSVSQQVTRKTHKENQDFGLPA